MDSYSPCSVLKTLINCLERTSLESGHSRLPEPVRACVQLMPQGTDASTHADIDVVLHQGSSASLQNLLQQLAQRPGPLVGCVQMADERSSIPLERLLVEHAVSINTAAAGGNASLMTMA